ncbi:xanthine dehydrogenase subunit XdhA [Enterococcus sp. CSURQ0835]|uniref:xanthine dehydrogenase subunit XdhA n=1 Tax=Enterococcus sp. CSURQ0835 TaxID=2681394 RepID=UPI0013599D96|nr:xanthine dehydrogenase subunit XdhA [Enterococcus sp. CSURQ0835]
MTNRTVGKTEQRWDAVAKVTGQANFTEDFPVNHLLHAKMLRATIAHGKVKAYDLSEAENIPGVVKIVLPEDVPQTKYATAGHPYSWNRQKKDIEDRLMLSRNIHVYGDEIAAVVAKTELAAEKALNKIKVEYEEYPVYLDPKAAMAKGAMRIHEERDNVIASTKVGYGELEDELEKSEHVVNEQLHTGIQQHAHMENQVAVAYRGADQRWLCISSTQIPHICRRICGEALGIPWSQIRIKKPFIGGGFGNKQDVTIEPLTIALSMLCGGKPVQIKLTREESLAFTRTRHAIDYDVRIGVKTDGTITGMDFKVISNQGGYASHGHAIGGKGGTFINSMYTMNSLNYEAKTVYTNQQAAGAMRGYGIPQVMYALESVVDDCADEVGIDPVEFRLKNTRAEGFFNTLSNLYQFDFKLAECLKKGREAFDWDHKRKACQAFNAQPENKDHKRGVGVGSFSYGSGTYPFGLEVSGARLILIQDGSFKLMLGSTEIGQGADTAFAQMAADTLGVTYDKIIRDAMTDTDIDPFDTGAYASRQTYVTGFAVKEAAEKMKAKIIKRASEIYDIRPEYIEIIENNLVYAHNEQLIAPLADVALASFYSPEHGQTIVAESSVNIHHNSYASGCTFAEVDVDIQTGRVTLLSMLNVHDSGKIINPLLATGQVEGGMAMGAAYGLSETLRYDAKGKILNNNLLDYKIPTMMDLPDFDHLFVESVDPLGPYGNKSLGENPICSPAGAIRNAVKHATGVKINEIPLATQTVFEKMKAAGLI